MQSVHGFDLLLKIFSLLDKLVPGSRCFRKLTLQGLLLGVGACLFDALFDCFLACPCQSLLGVCQLSLHTPELVLGRGQSVL